MANKLRNIIRILFGHETIDEEIDDLYQCVELCNISLALGIGDQVFLATQRDVHLARIKELGG